MGMQIKRNQNKPKHHFPTKIDLTDDDVDAWATTSQCRCIAKGSLVAQLDKIYVTSSVALGESRRCPPRRLHRSRHLWRQAPSELDTESEELETEGESRGNEGKGGGLALKERVVTGGKGSSKHMLEALTH